jgi:hypothetical protein
MFWLGINQSVRDLLRDLDVIRREDLDGTSPTRQIFARACFSFATATIGAIAITAPLYWIKLDGWLLLPDPMGHFTERTGGPEYQMPLPCYLTILAFWAAGLTGGLFGLARDAEHFNCYFKAWHSESEQAADLLSFITVTRWTFLPLEAWMDQLKDTDIYRLSAITLGGGAIGSLIFASGLLSVSINVERGAGWLPRRRARVGGEGCARRAKP